MLTLFTDTDTDITPAEADRYGYRLISMPYAIDGVTTYPYRDFDVFNGKEFYDRLRGGVLPTTSAISTEQYKEYFEPCFAAGDDILYVHFSRAMTATFENCDKAVAELLEKYPGCKYYEIDTKGITLGSYNVVCDIGELFLQGKTLEEVLEWSKTEIDKHAVYFFADDLKFFRHSGRVSGIAGTMGTLLGIRPIIYMNEEGKMVSIGKEKGRTKAMEHLINRMAELGDELDKHLITVGHADSPELANEMVALIRERFGENLNIRVVEVNPTAGSHCGPNTVGVGFHAIHR